MANMFVNAMTDVWNNVGTTYTAIKMSVTNTASSATSKLMDLLVGGVSKFSISKTGAVVSADTISATGGFLPAVTDGASFGSTTFRGSDLFGATGFVMDFNSDWVATHSAGILTVGTGDLRVTTAGTNAASLVTVGGTQTLTNKTLTTPTITLKTGNSSASADIRWNATDLRLNIGDGTNILTWSPDIIPTVLSSGGLTSADFTTIPSYATEITITFNGLSVNVDDTICLLLGDSGGFEISGYAGGYATTGGITSTNSALFKISPVSAAFSLVGHITLKRGGGSAREYVLAGQVGSEGGGFVSLSYGTMTTSTTTNRVRITTLSGTSTFDAGNINVTYK